MGRVFAAALVVLALAGCSVTTAPQPGLSADELAVRQQHLRDSWWASLGLSDDQRPAAPVVTVVSQEQWGNTFVTCMNDAGFDKYVESDGGYTLTGAEQNQEPDEAERLADYTCSTGIEVEGQNDGWYNGAQIEYLYDYFQEFLVPCLAVHGYEVSRASTREKFAQNLGGEHPYFSIADSQRDAFFADDTIPTECPPVPAGIDDPYSQLWLRDDGVLE